MLYKTDWQWELRRWSCKIQWIDTSTSSCYFFYRKHIGTANRNLNVDIRARFNTIETLITAISPQQPQYVLCPERDSLHHIHSCFNILTMAWNLSMENVASHADVFWVACISSLPINACLTENNIPFPLFYSHGQWPINTFEIKCWQAKHDS